MTKIFVVGHRGMVGSAIIRQLSKIDVELITVARDELDLLDQNRVRNFFNENKFDQVYLAAAKVGGIHANNSYPAEFIYENITIQTNIVHEAHRSGVQKLLFLGSSCIYPKFALQPISESELLTGPLEPTNEPYAIAKIAGIKMCESYNRQYGRDYRSVMPSNLYGEGDNFHPENSHVVPALIRRFHEAKEKNEPSVLCWGSGKPKRELLYVDDMAYASIHVMNLEPKKLNNLTNERLSHINVGTGIDCSIKHLAESIAKVVGFKGEILWDTSKPDGPPQKLLNVSLLDSMGWKAETSLYEGLLKTYEFFLKLEIDNDNSTDKAKF